MEKKHLYIAAGIIRDAQQQIFITQRAAESHMGGFWEFPGGKIEAGETPQQALCRELDEEVGICVKHSELLQTIEHEFTDKIITLHFFIVEQWDNEPYGREGQPSRWVDQKALIADEFPPLNRPIVNYLTH